MCRFDPIYGFRFHWIKSAIVQNHIILRKESCSLLLSSLSSGYPWFSVCVWWEGLSRQHRWHTGGRSWSTRSTFPCLRELDVGRKRRSQCRLWCRLSSGRSVHMQPFTESLFACSSGVIVFLRSCYWNKYHILYKKVFRYTAASVPADHIFLGCVFIYVPRYQLVLCFSFTSVFLLPSSWPNSTLRDQ